MKIYRKDPNKETPEEYEKCLIFPHLVIAEYQDDRFYSTNGRVMYMGVKSYILYKDILEFAEFKKYDDKEDI